MAEGEVLAGLLLSSPLHGNGQEVEARLDRLASTLVRRFCNRHGCTAAGTGKPPQGGEPQPCLHRNHRRDMAAAAEMLTILELTGTLATVSDYEAPAIYHTFTPHEAREWAGRGTLP